MSINPVIYNPVPESTENVVVPDEILELCEEMARNAHEVWATTRMEQGWTYGPTRDDAKKEHPCLVPYDELSEKEKQYDRDTALETLKLIIKYGYEIKEKKES